MLQCVSFSSLSIILLYGYTTICLTIYQLIDIWVGFSMEQLWIKLLWTFISCLGGHGFCFLIQSVFVFNNKKIWSVFLFTTLHWLHLYFQSKCNNEVNLNSFQSSHFCFLFVLLFLFCFLLLPLSELSEFCFVFMLPRFFSCWFDSCTHSSLSVFTLERSVFCLT